MTELAICLIVIALIVETRVAVWRTYKLMSKLQDDIRELTMKEEHLEYVTGLNTNSLSGVRDILKKLCLTEFK